MRAISSTKKLIVGLLGVLFLASGCQTNHAPKFADLDNTKFMSLWQTYNDCKLASDFVRAHTGMQQLSSAASLSQKNKSTEEFVLPLPAQLERMVSAPTNRLAVDVQAMTASCSLHTGQLALHEGQIDAARNAFSSVLTLPKDLSPYYVLQAKRYLTELEQGIYVSIKTP